ncbi:putative GroES-like superfamily, polyketide synthase, enoylreductase domain-containing protein [Septoria linicola]|nr:putative GroES-like superfamily, polyketide synthase, enoylreductase domain-containing protein [Septoria linicola]
MPIPKTAKAWTYTNGYPATLKQDTIQLPSQDEVKNEQSFIVKIAACALNPVDIQTQNLPNWNIPFTPRNYNTPKGTVMDFSGTVVEGGKSQFKAGDEIFGMALKPYAPAGGSLGEYAKFDVATTPAVKKPENWSFEKAAAISLVWLTAKACVEKVADWVEKTPSKRVAVLGGSSSVGIYTILLAKRRGWKVVATSSGKNKDFVLSDLKADEHVDYTSQDVRQGIATFKPDAVIDCVGGTECIGLPSSKRYISIVGDKTGRTVMGGPYTYYDFLHPITAATQWIRWAKGEYGMGESYDVVILSPKSEWLEDAKKTLTADDIHIDSVHAFEDAKKAFERLNTGRAKGKVVIQVSSKL